MLLYNVTTKIDPSIHENWVNWMKNTHIPAVMRTGCFTHYHFVRILDIDDSDGPTYAVQYFIENKEAQLLKLLMTALNFLIFGVQLMSLL